MNRMDAKKGFAIVAAIFIALILALAGGTYLMVVRGSGNMDQVAHSEVQSLYAAESGLLLGTRKLMMMDEVPSSSSTLISNADNIVINQHKVVVTIQDYAAASSSSTTEKDKIIISRAYDSKGNFVKRVSWRVRLIQAFEYGFFDDGVGSKGNKEFCGQTFYGDTYITSKDKGGDVGDFKLTCSNPSKWKCNHYYGGTLRIISAKSPVENPDRGCLDSLTENTQVLQASVSIPSSYTNIADSLRLKSGTILLNRADTLKFIYKYDTTFAYFGSDSLGPADKKIFKGTTFDIWVRGQVKGNTTVVSAPNKKLTISDDLTYVDYVDHYTGSGTTPPEPPVSIAMTSPNYLGLVGDGGIAFRNSKDTLHVNAAIVAWNSNPTIISELTLTGSNPLVIDGTVLLGEMQKEFAPFTFVQDKRMINNQPYGFPLGTKVANLFRFEISHWEESSVN